MSNLKAVVSRINGRSAEFLSQTLGSFYWQFLKAEAEQFDLVHAEVVAKRYGAFVIVLCSDEQKIWKQTMLEFK